MQGVKWTKERKREEESIDPSLQFLDIDTSKTNILGKVGGEHQIVMSTKGQKFRVKDVNVKAATIDGFKGRVNNQNILLKVQTEDTGEIENIESDVDDSEDGIEKESSNFVEVCEEDGTCKKVGLELSMKKYTKEENINDPDTETLKFTAGKMVDSQHAETDNDKDKSKPSEDIINIISEDSEIEVDENLDESISSENESGESDKDLDSKRSKDDKGDTLSRNVDKKYKVGDNTESKRDGSVNENEYKKSETNFDNSLNEKKHGDGEGDKLYSGVKSKTESLAEQMAPKPAQTQTVIPQPSSKARLGTEKLKDVLNMIKSFTEDYLSNKGIKSMRSLHDKLKYYSLYHRQKYEQLTCSAQPFHMRFSLMGEMFFPE